MGNPAIFPLLDNCDARDIVIVQINPIMRPGVPTTAREILNRVNEISFNSSMMREMRAISFVNRLIEEGIIAADRMKHILIHMIEAEELMAQFGFSSKLNTSWDFLTRLRDIGRERADHWLAKNFASLGLESTVDVGQKFL
jgi:NTE family protein